MSSPITSLTADGMRSILAQLADDDLVNARLACKAFRDQSKPPAVKCRSAYVRTRALAEYAWTALPDYVLPRTRVLWDKWQHEFNFGADTTEFKFECAPRLTYEKQDGDMLALVRLCEHLCVNTSEAGPDDLATDPPDAVHVNTSSALGIPTRARTTF